MYDIQGVPHPDPRMRPDRLSIRIPSAFWGRLRGHVERSRDSAAERAMWERWLTPAGVRALLAGWAEDRPAADSSGNRPAPSTRGGDPGAEGADGPEGPAWLRIRKTIADSLRRPLALRIDPEPGSRPGTPSADPTYLVVLSNGATLVLRITNSVHPRTRRASPPP